MSAITAKASRKMKKYAVLTREPRCFLGSFDFSWEQRKFDEVFDCTVPNNTLSRAELSYDEGTVLNVHYGDVLIKYGSVLDVQKDDIPRIPHRCREDFNGALLQDGDVIIADTAEDEMTGKACEIGNLQGSAIVSGLHTMVCRPRNRMALGYLGYYLNSNAYHHQLLPLMQGIKVLSLSRSNIQKTSVSYPIAVKEQQLIAYYFSQLDNLITLHQRKCALLFSPFQAFISMMFTTSTFSWEQRKLASLCEKFTDGDWIESKDQSDFGVRLVQTGNVGVAEYLDKPNNKKWISEDTFDRLHCEEVLPGDILISRSPEPAGRACIVPLLGTKMITAVDCTIVRTAPDMSNKFLVQYLSSQAYFDDVNTCLAGGTRQRISRGNLANFNVPIPVKKSEQDAIGMFFGYLDNLITLHQRKCIFFTGRAGRLISTVNKKRITSSWEQRKFEEIAVRSSVICSDDTLPRVEYEDIVSGTGRLNKDIYAKQSSKSGIVFHQGDVLYGKLRPYLQNWLLPTFDGLAVGDFWVLQPQNADSSFLYRLIQSRQFDEVANQSTGTKMPRADWKLVSKTVFSIPSNISEQAAIGTYFTALDSLITLHQRKPVLMKWRTSDANRNQTNRLVL